MKEKKAKSSQSKVGTILGAILCILLIPILIVNVTMIVKGYVHSDQVPTFGGYAPLIVLTDSMFPQIQSGDLIIIKTVDPQTLAEGDVISFFDPDGNGTSVVTHRIVDVLTDGGLQFVTKGDANNAEDLSPVPADSVVGLYQTQIAGAGNVAMFLQSTPGFFVCVGAPILLLVGYELIRRRRYERANKADTDALLAELEALRAQQAAKDKDE